MWSIKIWTLSDKELTLIKVIKEHKDCVNKIILLSNRSFVSCSDDKTVKVWKDDHSYDLLAKTF